MKCQNCKKQIINGYFCEESNKAWCDDCHENIDFEKYCGKYHTKLTGELGNLHFHKRIKNGDIQNG